MNLETLKHLLATEAREASVAGNRFDPEWLVERSRDQTHPLHQFIWSETDAQAAHQRRVQLAGILIRRCSYEADIRDGGSVRVPVFVRDPTLPDHVSGYVETRTIRSNREAARETLIHELTMLQAARNRVLALSVVLELEDEARYAMEQLELFGALVREASKRKRPPKPSGKK